MGGLLLKLQNFKKVKLIFGHPVSVKERIDSEQYNNFVRNTLMFFMKLFVTFWHKILYTYIWWNKIDFGGSKKNTEDCMLMR